SFQPKAPNSTMVTSSSTAETVVLYHQVYFERRSLLPVNVARATRGWWTTLMPSGSLSGSSAVMSLAFSAPNNGEVRYETPTPQPSTVKADKRRTRHIKHPPLGNQGNEKGDHGSPATAPVSMNCCCASGPRGSSVPAAAGAIRVEFTVRLRSGIGFKTVAW